MSTRILGSLACLVGLFALCFYSARLGSRAVDTIPEILDHPGMPDGQLVDLTSDVKVTETESREFTAEQGEEQIAVRIPEALLPGWETARTGIKQGDYISLRGVYRTPGYLEAREYHVHKGRRLKIWVSIAALLLAGFLIMKQAREGENA